MRKNRGAAVTVSLILEDRPGRWQRIDFNLTMQRWLSLAIFVVSAVGGLCLLVTKNTATSIALFVLGSSAAGLAFANAQNRHLQITGYAERTLVGMQEIWKSLLGEDAIIADMLAGDNHDTDPVLRFKQRLLLAAILDEFAIIVHYIRRGYYRHAEEFAAVYERMLISLFSYHCFQRIWTAHSGAVEYGSIRDEFGRDLVRIIDQILERQGNAAVPPASPSGNKPEGKVDNVLPQASSASDRPARR